MAQADVLTTAGEVPTRHGTFPNTGPVERFAVLTARKRRLAGERKTLRKQAAPINAMT
jgi:hypothetical protein